MVMSVDYLALYCSLFLIIFIIAKNDFMILAHHGDDGDDDIVNGMAGISSPRHREKKNGNCHDDHHDLGQQQQQQQQQQNNNKKQNQQIPTISLGLDVCNETVNMPLIGAGTWLYNDTIAYQSICKSFDAGYTFVDTAYGYKNQKGIGNAILDCWQGRNKKKKKKKNGNKNNNINTSTTAGGESASVSIVGRKSRMRRQRRRRFLLGTNDRNSFLTRIPNKETSTSSACPIRGRDDDHYDDDDDAAFSEQQDHQSSSLFIMTKIPGGLTRQEVWAAHRQNLWELGVTYVDHLMTHFPSDWETKHASREQRQEEWFALEEIYLAGEARSIGISHYCPNHIDDILDVATIRPSVNQVEYHVGAGDVDSVMDKCRTENITFMSFSPLCGPCQFDDPNDSLIDGTLVTDIAKQYDNVSGSQVALRFIIQQALQQGTMIGGVIPKSNNMEHILSNRDIFKFELSVKDMERLHHATQPKAEGGDCDVP